MTTRRRDGFSLISAVLSPDISSGYFCYFPLAGDGTTSGGVNGYYWSSAVYTGSRVFYLHVLPASSSVANYAPATTKYSVRPVRTVCARTDKFLCYFTDADAI